MFLSVFPYSALAYFFTSTEALQKFLYLLIFFLIPIVSFSVFYVHLRKKLSIWVSYVAATIGSIIYTINPNIVPNFFHYSYLWGYMLLPLVFHFTMSLINSKSFKQIVRSSLFLALIFPFMADSHMMLVGALLFAFLLVWHLIYQQNKHQLLFYLKKTILGALIVLVSSALVAGFWLMTYITVKPIAYWAVISTNTFVNNSPPLFSAISNVWYPQPFFSPSGFFQSVWLASIVVVIIGSLAVLMSPRDKVVLTLFVLSIIAFFLTKGTTQPLGSFYIWLSSSFPKFIGQQSLFDELLKYPSLFVTITCFSFSFLCAIVVGQIFNKVEIKRLWKVNVTYFANLNKKRLCLFGRLASIKNELFGISLMVLLLVSIGISSYPLVTGNMNGSVSPTVLPQQYVNMNNYLVNQGGNFRTIFFPESSDVIWGTGYTNKPDYFSISTPVLSYGWGTVPAVSMGFFGDFVYDSLLNASSQSIGDILSLANVKYVVYHNDTQDSVSYQTLYNTISQQNDLQLAFNESNLLLFKNTEDSQYIYGINSTVFVVGGLDSLLPLSQIIQGPLNDYAWIFLDEYPTNFTQLSNLLHLSRNNTVVFYGDKNFNDLLMDTIGQEYYTAPIGYLTATYPLTPWSIDTSFDYFWSQVVLSQFQGGQKHDFDLDNGIVYTSANNAILNIPVVLNESTQYESWIRLLENPLGGNVSISVDGHEIGLTNSRTVSLDGFKWVNIGNVTLSRGKHNVTIDNDNGFNAINLVSFVPEQKMADYSEQLSQLLINLNVNTVSISQSGEISGYIPNATKLPFVLSYKKIGATQYLVNVNASSPFMLVFSEPYNGLWSASADGVYFENIPVSSMVNGYWVNRTGTFSITLFYSPEADFRLGIVITVFSIIFIMICLALTFDKISWRIRKVLHFKIQS
jgi:hypothetical protein